MAKTLEFPALGLFYDLLYAIYSGLWKFPQAGQSAVWCSSNFERPFGIVIDLVGKENSIYEI